MRKLRNYLMVGLALFAALSAVAKDKKKDNKGKEQAVAPAADAVAAAPTASANAEEYRIGPQDVLQVTVWKEPDVSGSVPVRPDGKISIALLNDVQASGLTPIQLGADIAERLRKYLAEPRVTVTVTQMNSQRFYVMGEVARVGAYPLLPNETVLQGLSSAGGFSQYANAAKIYILRPQGGKQVKYSFNYRLVIRGEHPEQNIQLMPGDTIVVP